MIIPEGSNKNRYLAVVEMRVLANSKKKFKNINACKPLLKIKRQI